MVDDSSEADDHMIDDVNPEIQCTIYIGADCDYHSIGDSPEVSTQVREHHPSFLAKGGDSAHKQRKRRVTEKHQAN